MADILIKGLEIQDDWELLSINIDRSGKVTQSLDLKCEQIAEAIIVPPHGRLVDADLLYDKWIWGSTDRTADTKCIELIDLSLAPTVLETSEEDARHE